MDGGGIGTGTGTVAKLSGGDDEEGIYMSLSVMF